MSLLELFITKAKNEEIGEKRLILDVMHVSKFFLIGFMKIAVNIMTTKTKNEEIEEKRKVYEYCC